MHNKKARIIAFYLPQYHPIKENDKFWGKGFTEWTNVGKSVPLFKGHYQPRVPADLGYYDLRMPEVREEQAQLAKEAGIEGFCYWHYWFGKGKELLERPFNEVVDSGKPDFPFCLGWANHTWSTRTWTSSKSQYKETLIAEQTYPGDEDYILHFQKYLKAFKDPRYIKVDGKLLFVIFAPLMIPNFKHFKILWNELAQKEGLKGFHFVGLTENFKLQMNNGKINNIFKSEGVARQLYDTILEEGFDAVNSRGGNRAQVYASSALSYYLKRFIMKKLHIDIVLHIDYSKIIKNYYVKEDADENIYPTIIPNFDRSPRAGKKTNNIWHNSTPEKFGEMVKEALTIIKNKQPEHRILFLQSWNEWGEGNYMEPDLRFGKGYIKTLRKILDE